MKVLIDTNIVLDILLNNDAFYANSMAVFVYAEQKHLAGYVSASAVTDIYYISKKQLGKEAARNAVKKVLSVFQPAAVTGDDIFMALDLGWRDFEDSLQYVVGEGLSVDYIITRDTQDFSSSSIAVVTPEQFIQIIAEIEK